MPLEPINQLQVDLADMRAFGGTDLEEIMSEVTSLRLFRRRPRASSGQSGAIPRRLQRGPRLPPPF